MALPDITTQLYVDSTWTTYSSLEGESWSVQIGPDPETGAQPSQLEFTLANDDLSMDPTNPSSTLYGKIGRNTPARLRMDGTVLVTTEAASWRPERSINHTTGVRGLSTMAVTGAGLLQRMSRWEDPLDSPMRRQIGSYSSLLGYSPLEDASTAANLSQVVSGIPTGTYSGTVTLQGDAGAGGSDRCVTIGSDAELFGRFSARHSNGFQICWVTKLASAPSGAGYNAIMSWVDTVGRTWFWSVSNANMKVEVFDGDGTSIESSFTSYGTLDLTDWVRFRLKATVSGSTVTYEPAWYPQDGTAAVGYTDTFSSTATGRPKSWRVAGNSYTSGAAYGHVFAVSDTSLNLTTVYDAYATFNGYLGELAGERYARLMGEAGLTGYLGGSASTTVPMGRQKPDKLLNLITECVTSEAGILYDEPSDVATMFRTNANLLNQTAALALTYGTDVSPPLSKVIDDVQVVNDITVTNRDGSEVHVEQTTGALSTSPPPAGVGRYRKGLNVNLAGIDMVTDRGTWELNAGTLDRPRYQSVAINLLAFPGYRSAVNALRPGDWITISGLEADTITLMVMQIQRTGGAAQDMVTLKCLPAEIFRVLKAETVGYLVGSSSTTLGASATSTEGPLTLSTTNPKDVWTTTSAPISLVVSPISPAIIGEKVTVLWMSSAGTIVALDGGFETGLTGWTVAGGSAVQSSAFAHTGTYSAQLTVSGSPGTASISNTTMVTTTVGASYTATAWAYATGAVNNVRISISWYDSGSSFLSSSLGSTVNLTGGAWQRITVTATAPASAVKARYVPQIFSSPTNGTVVYFDDADMIADASGASGAGPFVQKAWVTRSVNGVVRAHSSGSAVQIFQPTRFGL